jgi:hypothetical protein
METFFFIVYSLLFGVLLCFGGYRFFMVMLPVWGFFGGLWAGAKGVRILLGEGFLATATSMTVGVLVGILLAIFAWKFYRAGVAMVGAAIGAWLGAGIMDRLGYESGHFPALVALLTGAVVGLVTYIRGWQRYLVIVLSAIGGANALVLALMLISGQISLETLQQAGTGVRPVIKYAALWSLGWLGLAIAGIIYQLRRFQENDFDKNEFVKYWS